jgi:hypothetical protein
LKFFTSLIFLRKAVSVATCLFRIFTHVLTIVAGVALDVLGKQEVQLFCHTNTGRFPTLLRNAVSVTRAIFLLI